VTETGGAVGDNYFSYGLQGGSFTIKLADGWHDLSYLMTAEASGNVIGSSVCSAVLYGNGPNGGGDVALLAAEIPQEGGPQAGEVFTSYCGAGARTGDPFYDPQTGQVGSFAIDDPIARAQAVNDLPEPVSAGLTLTALLAAAGVRRRIKR
jgi:MYXO-CTERM domain-containing protein